MTTPRHLALVTDGNTVPVADTPEGHLRNAIQACILAESRLAELLIPPDPQVTDLLRTVEARCFRALFELGSEVTLAAISVPQQPPS